MMICGALRRVRPLTQRALLGFADEKDPPNMQDLGINVEEKELLRRRFSGEVKIEERFHQKTSALYDKYMQVREKPIVCHDGLLLAYEFLIERPPIFVPYHQKTFEAERNRYVYGKRTGFYVEIPKDLRIQGAENAFREYDESNEENKISHQIVLSPTERINYRENSKLWRYTDPNIIDPHSIQTHSSNNVFMIVKEKGKWRFPTKLLNQKDTHNSVFNFFTHHLFQNTKYPNVDFPTKKPCGVRKVKWEGQEKEARVMTYKGLIAYGIPKFPTTIYEDYAWVPKPLLANYFEDDYFNQTVWAATHTF